MGNSTTCSNCSSMGACVPTPTTSSWVRRSSEIRAVVLNTALDLFCRRLCRPRLLQRRDLPPTSRPQSTLPRSHHTHPGQPREPADHTSTQYIPTSSHPLTYTCFLLCIRLLRRMPAQVRLLERVALVLRGLRLPRARRHGRRARLLRARRLESQLAHH